MDNNNYNNFNNPNGLNNQQNANGYGQQQSYTNAYNQSTQQNMQQGPTAFDQRQNATQVNYSQGYNQSANNNGSVGYAVTSMILGIISLPFCCVPIIGLILGVMAVIFGALSITQHRGGKGMAIAGLVCGAIGSLLSIIMWVANCVALL